MAIDKVNYWLDIVNDDLDTAEYLFRGGRWLYTAFMCHQVIEKVLKAYWCATREDDPLFTHSHTRLLEECGLMPELSDEQLRFIAMMIPMRSTYGRFAPQRTSKPAIRDTKVRWQAP